MYMLTLALAWFSKCHKLLKQPYKCHKNNIVYEVQMFTVIAVTLLIPEVNPTHNKELVFLEFKSGVSVVIE